MIRSGEIVVDNFAGGGGASTGMQLGLNRHVDIAINHDPAAIEMHKINHPETKHYCESVWDVDPIEACKDRPVGLAWFSPDCKHFSKAKGGTPVSKNIRGLAWVVARWAALVNVHRFHLENVVEFKDWGPVVETSPGKFKPDPQRKGETFGAFLKVLTTGLPADDPAWPELIEVLGDDFQYYGKLEKGLGYKVEFKSLSACDYGSPTTRSRLFLTGRNDKKPIYWPTPTHGKAGSGLKPYRTAAEIIDWSIPVKSIFGRKKPLAENTMKRIAKGLQKFVIDNPEPFIIRIGQTGFGGDRLSWSIKQPLTTVVTKAEHLLITPIIDRQYGQSKGNSVENPLGSVTAGGMGGSALIQPLLVQYYGPKKDSPDGFRGHEVTEPLKTLSTANRYGLVTSHIIKFRGDNIGHKTDEPIHTISAGGTHLGEVRAFLIKYYGTAVGQGIDEPLHTVTTKDRLGLVMVKGEPYQIVDIGMRMLEPRELFRAMGFPDDYEISHDSNGNKISKANQVARCGNAVCPPVAQAIVEANN